MHCGQKQWLNLKSQIMPFKVKAFYELPIFTLRNKAETLRNKAEKKTQLPQDHVPCRMSQTFKVLISDSKSTVLHISVRLEYHFLEEKSLKPAVIESNNYSGIHVKLSPAFEPAFF